jgi:hypothetical protein
MQRAVVIVVTVYPGRDHFQYSIWRANNRRSSISGCREWSTRRVPSVYRWDETGFRDACEFMLRRPGSLIRDERTARRNWSMRSRISSTFARSRSPDCRDFDSREKSRENLVSQSTRARLAGKGSDSISSTNPHCISSTSRSIIRGPDDNSDIEHIADWPFFRGIRTSTWR